VLGELTVMTFLFRCVMLLHRVAVAEDKMYFAGFFVHIQRRFSKGELLICIRVLIMDNAFKTSRLFRYEGG